MTNDTTTTGGASADAFPFGDRASWLAWRANWRTSYAEASETIRAAKRAMAGLHAERRTADDDGARRRIDARVSSIQENLAYDRRHAHALMVKRTKADEWRRAQLAARLDEAA